MRRWEPDDQVPEADLTEGLQVLDDVVDRADRLVAPWLGLAVTGEHVGERMLGLVSGVADDRRPDADRSLDLRFVAADLLAVPAQDLVFALHVRRTAAEIAG